MYFLFIALQKITFPSSVPNPDNLTSAQNYYFQMYSLGGKAFIRFFHPEKFSI